MDAITPLSLKIVLYAVMPLSKTVVMPLSKPHEGSRDVKASVTSQIPEDFTAHLEMHPLGHIRKGHMNLKIVLYAVMPLSKTAAMQLSKPQGGESKCRFPNTGGLHRTSGDAPLETHPERAHELENSVVCGNAVEQNDGNAIE
jgi:hypothetical protein